MAVIAKAIGGLVALALFLAAYAGLIAGTTYVVKLVWTA